MRHTLIGWKRTSWGNLTTLEYGKGLRGYQNSDGQYPVFGTNGQIGWHSECLCQSEGVIVGRKGAYRGIHYSDSPFFVIDTAFYLKPIVDGSFNTKWAYYQLLDFDINKMDSGSAIPSTSRDAFYAIQLNVPPLPTQRKIAAILSAYNDLIENNLRRIKILEEMTQNLYREWFVKFRFPGHQHARLVDSPLGRIPEGWEIKRLDELCSAVLDGDWIETKDQGGKDYRLLQISNIGLGDFVETGKFRYVTQETFDRLRCTEIQPDDLLIARMPSPIGRGWLARKMPWRIITAVDVAIARPDSHRISPVFLLHFWNQPSTLTAIEKQSSGTTRLRITRRELCVMPIPTPPLDLQEQFSAKARPMMDLANIMRDQNTTLRRTRDLLLPKLISGEVDVSELDIAVSEESSA